MPAQAKRRRHKLKWGQIPIQDSSQIGESNTKRNWALTPFQRLPAKHPNLSALTTIKKQQFLMLESVHQLNKPHA